MDSIHLRPTEPVRDFGQIATLFVSEGIEQTSEAILKADYEETKERIISLTTTENERGELLGFNGVYATALTPLLSMAIWS
jgi:hypothetical protein